jgi:hypothetical protein
MVASCRFGSTVAPIAPLADALDDIEAHIDQLIARTRTLELD